MVTGIYRRKGVIKEKKKLTARRLFPHPPQSFIQELTNWTRKSTKTSHVNPANRKIHSQALVVVVCMCVLWGSVCWRNRRDTLARLIFFQSIVAWKFTIKLPHKRNTIFNTTIQKKPFSSTLLKEKLSKLKREKKRPITLGKGRKGREERNPEHYKWTNFYTPRSH